MTNPQTTTPVSRGANKNRTLLIVIPMLILVTVMFIAFDRISVWNNEVITGENGVWDLRSLPFDGGERYSLRGQVEYIPDALLSPEEFAERENEALLGSNPLSVAQYATVRQRVFLPDSGYYSVGCRSVDFSQRTFINGVLAAEVGSPGETAETNVPNTDWINLTLTPVDTPDGQSGGYIEIVTQQSNFVHREGGVTTGLVFSNLFPWLSWAAKFRIEYMAFPVTAVLVAALLHELFPGILQKWFSYAFWVVSAVFAGIYLFANTVFMSHAIGWNMAAFLPAILYIVVRFIIKCRSVKTEQGVFLAGFGLFLFFAAHEMLSHNGINIIPMFSPRSSTAILILTFYQAAAVFIGNSC